MSDETDETEEVEGEEEPEAQYSRRPHAQQSADPVTALAWYLKNRDPEVFRAIVRKPELIEWVRLEKNAARVLEAIRLHNLSGQGLYDFIKRNCAQAPASVKGAAPAEEEEEGLLDKLRNWDWKVWAGIVVGVVILLLSAWIFLGSVFFWGSVYKGRARLEIQMAKSVKPTVINK